MTYLIIYMSHHGTTRRIANEMADRLGRNNVMVVNLSDMVMPDLELFDTILIGGSMHVGRVQKKIRKFCLKHRDILLQKRLGLFLCFMDKEYGQEEFHDAFPEDLRDHAIAHGLFCGELIIDKMNLFERLVLRKAKGVVENVSAIDRAAVTAFVEAVNEPATNRHRA